ncbi:MAG: hydroxyacid dehydrogenase [Christensenellales bacterium]|jgi:D-3-phosphoglycerate dehydrogenase
MKKVVLAQTADASVLDMLKGEADVLQVKEGDIEGLKAALSEAVAVIVGTWIKFDPELMDAAPQLKVISRTGAGVDSVDVDAASERGILVLNTPAANAVSVAEHAVALMMALSKQLFFLDSSVRAGNFKARRLYLPVDMDGKTLGLIGCGAIGRMAAQKCRSAFGMRVVGYDPFLTSSPEGIKLLPSKYDVFKEADFVSLHLPYTSDTKDTVDSSGLAAMKDSAFLINTSRGGIINEPDLVEALNNDTIAGAALDVFEKEPLPQGSPLISAKNIILTPHTAALTRECVVRVAQCATQGVIDYINGKTPEFVFNKKVLE